jgi:hypothetical protein
MSNKEKLENIPKLNFVLNQYTSLFIHSAIHNIVHLQSSMDSSPLENFVISQKNVFIYFSMCLSIPSVLLYLAEIITIICHRKFHTSFHTLFIFRAIPVSLQGNPPCDFKILYPRIFSTPWTPIMAIVFQICSALPSTISTPICPIGALPFSPS